MTYLGEITGPTVGIVMKELVRRAIATITGLTLTYEVHDKVGYDGGEDLFTTADVAAQAVYVKSLRECFSEIGLIGEEDDTSVQGSLDGRDAFFTIDPIDGTRAFVRRQSHGIGTMIALVVDGEVVAAFVGDVMTNEIYGYRPGSSKVHRISRFEQAELLTGYSGRPLRDQYLLLRERPEEHTVRGRALAGKDGPFKDLEITGGSIGISMARLWKGEVGAALLSPGKTTVWDMCPVWGISRALGFGFYRTDTLEPYEYVPDSREPIIDNPHELLVVHETHTEVLAALGR